MSKLLELTLGVMTALGGFVDIGELVFTSQAGAIFGYSLLWVVVLGTVGIITYGEMSGRVAAVSKQPVFNLVRQRMGFSLGLLALAGSNVLNVVTCAAEIGGIAVILQLLFGWPYRLGALAAVVVLMLMTWFFSFRIIERTFGLLGLLMVVFMIAAWKLQPDWHAVAAGLIPGPPPPPKPGSGATGLLYAYFVVGIFSSILLPYEVYFYSSGGIEEEWKPSDVLVNRVTSIGGFGLGALLAASLIVNGAVIFMPREIQPQILGTAALPPALVFGKWGTLAALCGMLFAIGGAAMETGLSGAYCISQFFGWEWGRLKGHKKAPRFTLAWITVFVLGLLIVESGIEPIQLVEYAVVLSIVVLPLTYFPILLIANDRNYMREYVNGRLANFFGWIYLVLIVVAALAAVPLLIATRGGA